MRHLAIAFAFLLLTGIYEPVVAQPKKQSTAGDVQPVPIEGVEILAASGVLIGVLSLFRRSRIRNQKP